MGGKYSVCAEEHEQLLEWLKELKAYRELEGLDLFWACDPLIKLVNKKGGTEND